MQLLLKIFLLIAVIQITVCRKSKKSSSSQKVESTGLFDTSRSYVTPITSFNWEAQVNKIRQTTQQVNIIFFYNPEDQTCKDFAAKYDEFCNNYRGVFKIGSTDCTVDAKICEKENVKEFPTVRIYPPQPMPAFDVEGELEIKKIMGKAAQQLASNAIEITSANHDSWIKENPSVPKVLLFTDKKGVPLIYKGLSVNLANKLFFGIIRSDEDILSDKYKVKEYPKILVVTSSSKKPIPYKGEIKFQPIFEFLNIYSEVFVPGGGSSSDTEATKQWLTEVVPQLHYKSASDICLKKEGILCVILVNSGKPEKDHIDILKNLNAKFDKKIDRGLGYKFMWLDAAQEEEWANLLKYEDQTKIVLLNPGKRKRTMDHEESITFEELSNTFEKVASGEGKFKSLKGDLDVFNTLRKDI